MSKIPGKTFFEVKILTDYGKHDIYYIRGGENENKRCRKSDTDSMGYILVVVFIHDNKGIMRSSA